jgi:quercetin dioxygenase-like cupin family protein
MPMDETTSETAHDNELASLSPTALFHRRQEMLNHLGKVDLEFDRRREQGRRHVKSDELQWVNANQITPTEADIKFCPIISPELGFNIHNIHMFMLEIAPNSEGGSYHRHGDAIKHYISGRGVEIIGGERYEVEAGDFIHIPANVWHGTQNPYDEPCRILAVQQFPGTYSQISAPFIDVSMLNK